MGRLVSVGVRVGVRYWSVRGGEVRCVRACVCVCVCVRVCARVYVCVDEGTVSVRACVHT